VSSFTFRSRQTFYVVWNWQPGIVFRSLSRWTAVRLPRSIKCSCERIQIETESQQKDFRHSQLATRFFRGPRRIKLEKHARINWCKLQNRRKLKAPKISIKCTLRDFKIVIDVGHGEILNEAVWQRIEIKFGRRKWKLSAKRARSMR
jgi:hypothetical protein